MNSREQLEKMVEEALKSLDGATRARPRPYLFTRMQARMDKVNENAWERTMSFVARPVVAFAGLALVISINVFVITRDNSNPDKMALTEQQATADEFSSPVATLYDEIENAEP